MNGAKISIILPSLNVHEFIHECIESVIHQTLQDIEIICVDAGSTDGTLEILHEYEKQDNRIKVIVSDRKSYGYQMNLGIKAAGGEYIGIVETDDLIPRQMYQELYETAKENDVDFVKADFYRFTGNGDERYLDKVALTNDKSYYGRIIDIEKEPDCLSLNMVTCCGIYKREFIAENHIVYNETPGASYQDNGFWFQTFIYAHRALFIDEPYYMIRRDNPGSSVYNHEKVYCICDEYRFILDILQKNERKYECFKAYFAYQYYRAFKGTLRRVDNLYRRDVILRFSDEFRKLSEMRLFNPELFDETNWNVLTALIENPLAVYERNIVVLNRVVDIICTYENIIIYGAGMVGQRILRELELKGKRSNILCFTVSKATEGMNQYLGIPIRPIEEITDNQDQTAMVVAVTASFRDEMIETARRFGFRNIIPIPETDL